MSPPRRRSARLASASKKPVAAAPNLTSLIEGEENGGEAAMQSLNAIVSSPTPHTPASSSPAKPPRSEMHPSKAHSTMAAPSSGLRLGFVDIKPADRNQPSVAALQSTPSKSMVPSSPFTFRFTRQQADLGLSNDAQRMMDELREEALKIKADLTAQREHEKEQEEEMAGSRKIAHPKGRAGRFSAAHMAAFKKMDSIENHPSAFRAQAGKFTPLTKGVKRTSSRANLEDAEAVRARDTASASPPKKSNILFGDNHRPPSRKGNLLFGDEPSTAAKRMRQHMDDDASSGRPVSRDGSFIPRPMTAGKDSAGGIPRSQTMASLMTPTKASLARAGSLKTPTAGSSMLKSPSKSNMLSGLKRSATTHNLQATEEKEEEETTDSVVSPTPFGKVKSILRGQKTAPHSVKSSLPKPAAPISKTPAPSRVEKPLPPLPMTTPRRKLVKRVDFTPETKRAALTQNSPTPFKSGIPRSATRSNLSEMHLPKSAKAGKAAADAISYPDLSALLPPTGSPPRASDNVVSPPTVPGTFTFRSDHTISFGSAPASGFGSSPGQASVRHVRSSVMPTVDMPGSFPCSVTTAGSDKENSAPVPLIPHGIPNKKRHRVSEAEEAEEEAAQRAAKKRKNEPVPEGDALLAPRLMAAHRGQQQKPGFATPKKPSKIAGFSGAATSSPKKRSVLSLSRLNMLARPKLRK